MSKKITYGFFLLTLLMSIGLVTFAQNPNDLNCTATPDQVLGQAFRGGAGVVGEIAEEGLTPEGLNIEDEGLAVDAAWLVDNLMYSSGGTNPVAIIVIDDFSTEPDAEAVSHGWLVWEVLNDLLAELPPEVASQIALSQINIAGENGYRSDLVVTALQTRMGELSASSGITRFVLNMSFVIVPCQDQNLNFNFFDFLAEHENDPGKSIVGELTNDPAYLQDILENTSVEYIEETKFQMRGNAGQPAYIQEKLLIFRLFENTKLQSDPLRQFLRQQRQYTIIPVAASGNFKWKRPFYPARWSEVLSVSASEGEDIARWSHSNNGDVTVPGAWYLFDDGVYRAGTSLAAPVVSMMTAVDLTQATPKCGIRGNAPEAAKGRFQNRPLLTAVNSDC
jgi:Subtilase family